MTCGILPTEWECPCDDGGDVDKLRDVRERAGLEFGGPAASLDKGASVSLDMSHLR